MFSVIAAFPLLIFLGSMCLPESPRWLAYRGKIEKAKHIFKQLGYSDNAVQLELSRCQKIRTESPAKVMRMPRYLKILCVGIMLQIFQQLVGINVMIYYSPKIFSDANLTSGIITLLVPLVHMLSAIFALKVIDKWGRKKLLRRGSYMMFFAMIVSGFVFYFMGLDKVPLPILQTALLAAFVVYIFAFAISWGRLSGCCVQKFSLHKVGN